MSETNKKINSSPEQEVSIKLIFRSEINDLIKSLALHKQKSISELLQELILEALDKQEDFYLTTIGENRESEDSKTMKHKDAWKQR